MNLPQRCVDYSSLSSLYYVNVNKHTVLIPHCNIVEIVELSGVETTVPPIFVLPGSGVIRAISDGQKPNWIPIF